MASFPVCVNSFKGHIYQWTSCTGSCVWTNVCGSEGWECRGALALEPCPLTGGGALPFICLSPWRPIGPRVPWPLGSVQYCHLILSFLLHNCFPHLRVWLFSFFLVPPFPLFHCPPPVVKSSLTLGCSHSPSSFHTAHPPFLRLFLHGSTPSFSSSADCRAAVSGSAAEDYVLRGHWPYDCVKGG